MPDDSQHFDEDSDFIPLDRDDPSFGMWKQQRDASGDPKREPGPIRLQRFDSGLPYVGIPTFFKLPVALNPADLKAGKVEVAILGAPVDMGYSMRGAAWGPQAVRTSERSLPYGPALGPHVHVNVNPFQALGKCVDLHSARSFAVSRVSPDAMDQENPGSWAWR